MNTQYDFKQISEDYLRIEQAILYLENHYKEQPSLEEVAANIGLSEYHFQRLFTRWAGVSPKRFLQFLTKEGAKELLEPVRESAGYHASGRAFQPGTPA